MRAWLMSGLIAVSLLAFSSRLAAQAQTSIDIITGRVTNKDGAPLEGVKVVVRSVASQVGRETRTNKDGRYTVVFPDGDGNYVVAARAIGFHPAHVIVTKVGQPDRIFANITMSATAAILDSVVTTASRDDGADSIRQRALTRTFTMEQMRRLGIAPGDIKALAALTPGMMVDSLGNITFNGRRSTVNVDGMPGNPSLLPPDAIAGVQVTPNNFDPAHGLAGPNFNIITRGGTNTPSGNVDITESNRYFEIGAPASVDNTFLTSQTLGMGYGGPIIRDRLLSFVAGSVRYGTSSATSLLNADPALLTTLGVAPDSVQHLLQVLHQAGVPAGPFGDAPRTMADKSGNLFGRLDYLPSSDETIAFSMTMSGGLTEPGSVGPLALASVGTGSSNQNWRFEAGITSHLSIGLINQLGVGLTTSHSANDPVNALPSASVVVGSLATGTTGTSGFQSIRFGGSGSAGTVTSSTNMTLNDELSWLTPNAGHRPRLGGSIAMSRSTSGAPNAYGAYTYTSMADLEAGQAATYTRLLNAIALNSGATSGAVYAEDDWQISSAVHLSYGIRANISALGLLPAYDPTVDSVFHRRTDRVPPQLNWDPSISGEWIIPAKAHPPTVAHFGVGLSQAFAPGGGGGSVGPPQIVLSCSGSDVPAPQWAGYANGTAALPTTCTDGTTGASTTPASSDALPTVTVYDPRAAMTLVWNGSVGLSVPVSPIFSFSVDLSGNVGNGNAGRTDLNLNSTPQFFLADEGNRPVYASAGLIDPASGAIPIQATRLYPDFGPVISYTTSLHQISGTLGLGGTLMVPGGHMLALSYSYSRARDQQFYPTPYVATWAPSASDGVQTMSVGAGQQIGRNLSLNVSLRASSGSRYTPLVNTDVTGGGIDQPPAFVFNPAVAAASGDTAVASGIQNLLNHGNSSLRACLLQNLGRVAQRNSCRGPWQTGFDVGLGGGVPIGFLRHRLQFAVGVSSNVLTGLDDLVHGPDHLGGWGQVANRPDPVLLYVEGFDPSTQRYIYAVNPRFGSTTATNRLLQQAPAQINVSGSYTFGRR